MTAVQPIFPSGIFTWTDRVDQQSIDFANDINSIASEVISLENTLGTNPEIESNPPTGNPVTYSSVSARISDAMTNKELPVCELSSTSILVQNTVVGQVNTYKAAYDPYKMFNGTDLTISADGWWYITASQTFLGWSDGYDHFSLCLNGTSNIVDDQLVNWDFPGNNVINGQPGRWQIFGLRPITSTLVFQGLAHKGDRFSGFSENGTSNTSRKIINLSMKASMLRRITGSFTSG